LEACRFGQLEDRRTGCTESCGGSCDFDNLGMSNRPACRPLELRPEALRTASDAAQETKHPCRMPYSTQAEPPAVSLASGSDCTPSGWRSCGSGTNCKSNRLPSVRLALLVVQHDLAVGLSACCTYCMRRGLHNCDSGRSRTPNPLRAFASHRLCTRLSNTQPSLLARF